jgi:hypothetical protein
MKTRFLLIRCTLNPNSFVLMEIDEQGFGTGAAAVHLTLEALARVCDDLEKKNHMEETHGPSDGLPATEEQAAGASGSV